MNSENLSKIHNALLFIMDEINRLCEANQIKYSLIGESLLGAVRHNGYIPWDDDMDIIMMRNDYDKFISLCNEQLDKRFGVITIDNTNNYGYGFAKITLHGTKVKQTNDKSSEAKEIWVDVFPLDYIPNSKIKRFVQKSINYVCIKMLEENTMGLEHQKSYLKELYSVYYTA